MDLSLRSGRMRVLAVDDCPDTLESLDVLLRLWGFDARTTPDGDRALALARSFRPSVILLDPALASMDGLELTRRLRGEGIWPVVLCVSGCGGEDVRRHCLEAGCHAYLDKPVDPEQLRRVLVSLAALPGASPHAEARPSRAVSVGS